ncbi:Serine/threonine-protein kinase [Ceratobasidium sp. AG-Ba]|nr:Serine/threonine-protein kinase [Ceratobasidium sp. AG-Ba]
MGYATNDARPDHFTSFLQPRARVIISKDTPIDDIVLALTEHGCKDLTAELDHTSHSAHPVISGGYGNITRGAMRSGTAVAIKSLRVPIGPDEEQNKIPKRAARELYTWSRCSHRNVLPLLGLVVFHNQIRMLSLWMPNGDLPGYLKKNAFVDRYVMCQQVCDGMDYLHGVPMVHGDMKGTNVLVSDEGVPVITDFGNAVFQYGELQFTQTMKLNGFTPRWTSPELLIEDTICQSQEADVYALGMTILEVITGDVPYAEHKNEMKLLFAIGSQKLLPNRPEMHIPNTLRGDALWLLLRRCWNKKPEKRPKAYEVVEIMRQISEGNYGQVTSNRNCVIA